MIESAPIWTSCIDERAFRIDDGDALGIRDSRFLRRITRSMAVSS